MLSTEITIPETFRIQEIEVITEQVKRIVIEAVERQQLNLGYELSEEEVIAISLLLVEQLEMHELCSANIRQMTLH